jgi:magnesium transporter
MVEYYSDKHPEVDELEELVDTQDKTAIRNYLMLLHPADMAMVFEELDRDMWQEVVSQLSIGQISDLLEELPEHLRDDLAELLRTDQLVRAFSKMASDDAADIITDLPSEVAEVVLASIPKEDRLEVEELLKYPEDSAGGLMQTELVSISEDSTVDQAVEAIRANKEEVGDLHFVFVVNKDGMLAGKLPLEKLILGHADEPIIEMVERDIHAVTPEVDQEEIALMFKRYDLVSLPVVDQQGKLLGRILHDDAIDVMEEEVDEDIMRMAGAEEAELVYTNRIFKIAWVRLPWLLTTVGGGLFSGFLLWQFKISFPHILALLTFIPAVAAMGGNIGTQSSTIVVRGFATGRIDFNNLSRLLARELAIGMIIGLVCGLAIGLMAQLWHGDLMLGIAVGIAMMATITASAIMGVSVPFLFKAINVDPAIAAGPLVTTTNDIMGIAIYYFVSLMIMTG